MILNHIVWLEFLFIKEDKCLDLAYTLLGDI